MQRRISAWFAMCWVGDARPRSQVANRAVDPEWTLAPNTVAAGIQP